MLPILGMLGPFLMVLLVFQYWPLAILAKDSTYRYSLLNTDQRTFVGVGNFVDVFTDPAAIQSLLITLIFIAGVVVLVIPIALVLAVYLNGKLPARPLIRVLVFLPVVTSSVVVATMWTFMLGDKGLINSVTDLVGIPPISFLADVDFALPAIIVMTAWQQVGLAMVLFLGGLQSIPQDVYEAAELDGAGPLRSLWSITIPLLSRSTLVTVVIVTVFALQAFAPAYLMTNGAPQGTTNLIIYHIYKTAFELQNPGYASALSIVVLVFAITVALIQMRLLRSRWTY